MKTYFFLLEVGDALGMGPVLDLIAGPDLDLIAGPDLDLIAGPDFDLIPDLAVSGLDMSHGFKVSFTILVKNRR